MDTRQQLIKKLLYQSCNRGCKETDLILGNFAKENINNMTDSELVIFSSILKLADSDIYDWYTKKKDVPKDNQSSIMAQILTFKL